MIPVFIFLVVTQLQYSRIARLVHPAGNNAADILSLHSVGIDYYFCRGMYAQLHKGLGTLCHSIAYTKTAVESKTRRTALVCHSK